MQDVYEWAGEFRNVPIKKGTSVFCRPEFIVQEIDKITNAINILRLKKMDFKMFSKNLTEIVGELNVVRPFLDCPFQQKADTHSPLKKQFYAMSGVRPDQGRPVSTY